MLDARTQPGRRAAQLREHRENGTVESRDVVGLAVGERSLGIGPHVFVGIELRRVRREVRELSRNRRLDALRTTSASKASPRRRTCIACRLQGLRVASRTQSRYAAEPAVMGSAITSGLS